MRFNMTTPCLHCPFRSDIRPFLRRARAREIADSLTRQQESFPCHKTTHFDEDGDVVISANEEHCAGALLMLERANRPNQMMRIAERIGLYDRRKLDKKAPVFKTFAAFIAAQGTKR